MTIFTTYQGSQLTCKVYGEGSKAILTFHGYGLNKSAFEPVSEAMGKMYTIYSFDLFFHGESTLSERFDCISKAHLVGLINKFLSKQRIYTFSLMGHSLGAKFCLVLFEKFHERVECLWLLAPDGIYNNVWYHLATRTNWGRAVFKYIVSDPASLFFLLSFLQIFKLIDRSTFRFVRAEMSNIVKRKRVYKTWVACRTLTVDFSNITRLLNTGSIPFFLYLGMFDRVVNRHEILQLSVKISQKKVVFLPCGHTQVLRYFTESKQGV